MALSRKCNLTEFTFAGRQDVPTVLMVNSIWLWSELKQVKRNLCECTFSRISFNRTQKNRGKKLPLLLAGLVRHLFRQDLEFPLKTKQKHAQPLPTKITNKGKALLKDVNDLPWHLGSPGDPAALVVQSHPTIKDQLELAPMKLCSFEAIISD